MANLRCRDVELWRGSSDSPRSARPANKDGRALPPKKPTFAGLLLKIHLAL
jgi:hypothetical protein